jgi:hypothetical protein
MTAKNATSRGPLGSWPRTALSRRRACAGLTTLRWSTSCVVFGAFHFRALMGLLLRIRSSTACSRALARTAAHFAGIYGASVSKETVSRITDKVTGEMQAWQNRPLDEVYAAVFTGAVVVKIRDGQVANRPVCAAIGVTGGAYRLTITASNGVAWRPPPRRSRSPWIKLPPSPPLARRPSGPASATPSRCGP